MVGSRQADQSEVPECAASSGRLPRGFALLDRHPFVCLSVEGQDRTGEAGQDGPCAPRDPDTLLRMVRDPMHCHAGG